MTVQVSINYGGAFSWADSDNDPYSRETQMAGLAIAFEGHDHSNGKGAPIGAPAGTFLELLGADRVSATNLSLGTDGNTFHVTGTTQIDRISIVGWNGTAQAGVVRLIFDGILTVRHNQAASGTNKGIALFDAANYTSVAGAVLTLVYDPDDAIWRELSRKHTHVAGDISGVAPTSHTHVEGDLSLTDITTADVSATKHGFAPKFPNNTTTFLRGDGTYATPPAGGLGIAAATWTDFATATGGFQDVTGATLTLNPTVAGIMYAVATVNGADDESYRMVLDGNNSITYNGSGGVGAVCMALAVSAGARTVKMQFNNSSDPSTKTMGPGALIAWFVPS